MTKNLFALLCLVSFVGQAHAADKTLQERPRYTLQAGDTLDLGLRFTPEYNQTLVIQPDGYITVNLIGDVKVQGLTLDQARSALEEKLSVRLNKPELNLVLKDFQHPYVVVGGEVQQPGKIELRQNLTAMQAVMLAGGFRGSARDTRVVVFRHINADMGEVKILNLHKILTDKDLERDMVLQQGDMILVPWNRVETFSRYMAATRFSSAIAASTVP
jgi:polysaccharide export outer membrane protein